MHVVSYKRHRMVQYGAMLVAYVAAVAVRTLECALSSCQMRHILEQVSTHDHPDPKQKADSPLAGQEHDDGAKQCSASEDTIGNCR